MTAVALLRRLERAETLGRALVDPPAVPDPAALFRTAFGQPDAWQLRALRSTAPRILMNASRQAGKTGVAATLACHAALAEAGALVLVVAPGLRQSQEAFRRVLDVYRAAGRPTPPDAETKLTLELVNGARILALPGSERTIRGYAAVHLLVIDEAARVADETYAAVRPTLAVSGGRLVALSTPWGARGWWHAAWTSDEPWDRYEVPATACPRIPPAFLEQERRSMGDLPFRSEYLCEFCDTIDNAFSSEHIAAALDDTIQPLWGAA